MFVLLGSGNLSNNLRHLSQLQWFGFSDTSDLRVAPGHRGRKEE